MHAHVHDAESNAMFFAVIAAKLQTADIIIDCCLERGSSHLLLAPPHVRMQSNGTLCNMLSMRDTVHPRQVIYLQNAPPCLEIFDTCHHARVARRFAVEPECSSVVDPHHAQLQGFFIRFGLEVNGLWCVVALKTRTVATWLPAVDARC